MHPFHIRLLIALVFLIIGVIAIIARHRADQKTSTRLPDAEEQFFDNLRRIRR